MKHHYIKNIIQNRHFLYLGGLDLGPYICQVRILPLRYIVNLTPQHEKNYLLISKAK